MKTISKSLLINLFIILLLSAGVLKTASAQNRENSDSIRKSKSEIKAPHRKNFRMTSLTFGGNGVNFTKVNNQFTVMTGGRGSATFNNHYTIGGGGWGMTKGAEVGSDIDGTYNFIKIGYGGVDIGYIFPIGEKMNFGVKLLIGGGAIFKETIPKSDNKGFRLFPVLEPTAYYQISLSKLFRLEIGANYRIIRGTNLPYISDRDLGGFALYVGFLVKTCNCN